MRSTTNNENNCQPIPRRVLTIPLPSTSADNPMPNNPLTSGDHHMPNNPSTSCDHPMPDNPQASDEPPMSDTLPPSTSVQPNEQSMTASSKVFIQTRVGGLPPSRI